MKPFARRPYCCLKSQSGEIKEIIEVDLPRPRDAEVMLTTEFKKLRQRVDYLVHADEDELDPALQNYQSFRV